MNSDEPPVGQPIPGCRTTVITTLGQDLAEVPDQAATPPLGSPATGPVGITPVSGPNKEALERANAEKASESTDAMAGTVFGGVPEVHLPAFLLNSTSLLFVSAVAGVVGLFVYAQVVSVFGQIPWLPIWLQFTSYAVLLVFAAMVVAFGVRLVLIYYRLKRGRKISLKGLDELKARAEYRSLCRIEACEAKKHLLEYLESYPIDERTRLIALGFKESQIADLRRCRGELMAPGGSLGSSHWIREFEMTFQNILDQVANARISYHARRVGLRTVVLPFALADTLAVIYSCFALTGDLCLIYNLRLGRVASIVVVVWAAIQSVLAGRFEDSTTVDMFNEEVIKSTVGENGSNSILGALAGHAANMAGEGAGRIFGRRAMRAVEQAIIQGLLLKRLGKCIKGWLRMVE